MHRLSYLPNLLSSLRITLAPAMLAAAYSNSKVGFAILLAATLVTDAIDGVLARRWKAETELGARLDHWGDVLTATLGVVGVFFLWPQVVEREWVSAAVAVGGYVAAGVGRLLQPEDPPSCRGWTAKLLSWLLPASLLPLVNDVATWPFQAAAALQLALGVWRVIRASAMNAKKKTEEAVA
jgi:Phosphatidylglycerophosphate synthase